MTEPHLDRPHSGSPCAAPSPQPVDGAASAAPGLRVAVGNVGCKLNQHEVEALSQGFDRRGYRVVGPREPADVVVVNTCTVTGAGDADSRRAVTVQVFTTTTSAGSRGPTTRYPRRSNP